MTSPDDAPRVKPPAKRRALLVVAVTGGVALAVAAGALLVGGVFDGSEAAQTHRPDEVDDSDRGGYIEVADPCGQLDLTGYEEIAPVEIPATEIQYEPESEVEASWQCRTESMEEEGGTSGRFELTARLYATPEEAEQRYLNSDGESSIWQDSAAADHESAVSGDWARGIQGFADMADDDQSLETVVQDDNLVVSVYFRVEGDGASDVGLEDMSELETETVDAALQQATA